MEKILGKMRLLCVLVVLFGLSATNLLQAGDLKGKSGPENAELPVFATDAGRGLPFMLASMRGRKAFLLGDGTHGTDEFYAFRKRVTRHLIRDLGVRILVLESEWDGGRMVDAYIRGVLPGVTDARELLLEAFSYWPQWVWANEEMVEFVEWLKDVNSRLPPEQMVRCHGMDMQFAIRTALDALAGVWPADSRPGRIYDDLCRWWRQYENFPMDYNRAYAEGKETGNLLATELLRALPAGNPELQRRLRMLVAAEEYYRITASSQYQAWNVRSRHFAGFVEELLREPPGAGGVVVWAHNSHVGDMSATDVQDTGLLSFGQLLRQRLGHEQVFILGSTGYAGTVLAAPEWYGDPVEMPVPPAAPGSVEAIIESGGWDNALLLFQDDDHKNSWSMPLLHRGIGVAYTPEAEMPSYYLTARIGSRYDALVFWRRTRSLQQLVAP